MHVRVQTSWEQGYRNMSLTFLAHMVSVLDSKSHTDCSWILITEIEPMICTNRRSERTPHIWSTVSHAHSLSTQVGEHSTQCRRDDGWTVVLECSLSSPMCLETLHWDCGDWGTFCMLPRPSTPRGSCVRVCVCEHVHVHAYVQCVKVSDMCTHWQRNGIKSAMH